MKKEEEEECQDIKIIKILNNMFPFPSLSVLL